MGDLATGGFDSPDRARVDPANLDAAAATAPKDSGGCIAIIGMSARFPGATSVDAFWRNLRDGVESVSFFSAAELRAAGVDQAELEDPDYVRARAVLDDVYGFDAAFFDYSPREAALMDPQHRLFLECAWTALENAGYDPHRSDGAVGVYASSSRSTYLNHTRLGGDLDGPGRELQREVANHEGFLATRVSYKLDLKGPSVVVQTACSSGLVAVAEACQSLLSYQCDIALAGGVSVGFPQPKGYLHQPGGIASPDGHCRAFDAMAQGTVGGEGVAVVVLKRLAEAQEDRDCIHAVILGSALNNDGAAKVSYAATSVDGQTEVIALAQAIAGVHPETVSYVETHGTGTRLGDSIEVAALTRAFRARTDKKHFCAIGSVKTNIGHLDAAAGIAGLIKTTLALRNRQLPPSLHCDTPDPRIDFPSTPFYVNDKLRDWVSADPLRAGVSSFGIGGTNVHVILEEAPPPPPTGPPARAPQLLTLSARTPAALEVATEQLADHLEQNPDLNVADVAYTLRVGRKDMQHRRILVCDSTAEAVHTLRFGRLPRQPQEHEDRGVAFLFPGQGAQHIRMGREVYQQEPLFREVVDDCCERLQDHLDLDLRESLFPADEDAADATVALEQTRLAQPALFVIEYALARLWMAWGVRPAAMVGHSIGEFVAATVAGVFTREDGLALVAARGRLMQSMPRGSMLSVPLPADQVQSLLGENLALAAVNERATSVVSGPTEAVEAFEASLEAKGVEGRRLHTSHAFHSAMMEPVLGPFVELFDEIQCHQPQIPYVSNLTGTWITAKQATDPGYWAQHLRRGVLFADGLETILRDGTGVLLEVGPGNTLTALAKRIVRGVDQTAFQSGSPPASTSGSARSQTSIVNSLSHPEEKRPELRSLLDALGRLWVAGAAIDWTGFYAGEKRARLALPTYPFERQRYRIEPATAEERAGRSGAVRRKADIADWFYLHSWKRSASPLAASAQEVETSWLVFDRSPDSSDPLLARLSRQGTIEAIVRPGSQFEAEEGGEFTIRLGCPEDYDALVRELGDQLPSHVVHLWGVGLEDRGDEASLENIQDHAFYSLLSLAQAFARLDREDLPVITVVTSNGQSVTGAENLSPALAAMLGACQAISQELPTLRCRCVDLEEKTTQEDVWAPAQVDQLVTELVSSSSDLYVAYRGQHRWVKCYEPYRLEAVEGMPRRLRERGVYLITGGLGASGLEVADSLARAAKARLVLVGRSEFPARDDWDEWLKIHDDEDLDSRRILKIREMERAGAEVLPLRGDSTDLESMKSILEQVEQEFGTLNGLVHAAGADKTAMLVVDTTREDCERQFRTKLQGLLVLEQVLEGRELDFCILQSSLSSVLGALGLISYVASHQFMDAYVLQHNRTHSVLWDSVNWDNWLSWRKPEIVASRGEAILIMQPEEAVDAFLRVLNAGPGTQVAVSTGDLQRRIDQWVRGHAGPVEETPSDAPELHQRPELSSDFVAPRNPVEEILADVWGQALGLKELGIHDSFFELGGDSLMGILLVTKARQKGVQINSGMIFEYQTIAEMAAAASTIGETEAVQGLVDGEAPLSPIQHWFFEQDVPDPHHFNLPILTELEEVCDPATLHKVLAALAAHHDALRLRYARKGGVVRQVYAAADDEDWVRCFDLADLPAAEQETAMAAHAAEIQTSLDLENGPLMRLAVFDRGPDHPAPMLWTIHHLLVDMVAWGVLFEDFHTALRQCRSGAEIRLSPKTTSFRRWAEIVHEHAAAPETRREVAHWKAVASTAVPLPVDSSDGENMFGTARTLHVCLAPDETRSLLKDPPQAYRTKTDEVLLTALVRAVGRWTGEPSLLLDLEGNGREWLHPSVDLSRTVGWFTSIYPARLTLEPGAGPGVALRAVKEQLRSIPCHGIGFGLLKYLSKDADVAAEMRALPTPQLNFVYLGQLDQVHASAAPFKLLEEHSGPPCSDDLRRPHLLEVVALVRGGQLRVAWTYSERRHRRETIARLAADFLAELRDLIEHCRSPDAGGYTPSDFPAARLNQVALDKLMAKLDESPEEQPRG